MILRRPTRYPIFCGITHYAAQPCSRSVLTRHDPHRQAGNRFATPHIQAKPSPDVPPTVPQSGWQVTKPPVTANSGHRAMPQKCQNRKWNAPLRVDTGQAARLTIRRACSCSNLAGLRYPSAEWSRLLPCIDAPTNRIANQPGVEDRGEIHEPPCDRDVGDVGHPE